VKGHSLDTIGFCFKDGNETCVHGCWICDQRVMIEKILSNLEGLRFDTPLIRAVHRCAEATRMMTRLTVNHLHCCCSHKLSTDDVKSDVYRSRPCIRVQKTTRKRVSRGVSKSLASSLAMTLYGLVTTKRSILHCTCYVELDGTALCASPSGHDLTWRPHQSNDTMLSQIFIIRFFTTTVMFEGDNVA
jgi:hypothetical protein